jgi:hypothetical protein
MKLKWQVSLMRIDRISITAIAVLLFVGAGSVAVAQTTRDFASRQNIGISWEAAKNTELTVRYRVELFDNITRFNRSLFSFAASQELLKGLRAGGEYRYYTSYDKDFHRFQAYLRYAYKLNKKITFNYRLQYQQRQDYFDEEYLTFYPPVRIWRNRLQARYGYTKKLELYAYGELFHEMGRGQLSPYRMRYGIGIDYLFRKKHGFTIELFANDEFNMNRPEDVLVLDLAYQFQIKREKKKKAKGTADPAKQE